MAQWHKLQKFLDELPKKTGEELQDFLNELVTTHWQEGKKYKFRMPIDQEPPAFSIEVDPTPNQPGDGRVTFRRYDSITSTWREHAPTWRELLPPVLNPQFPSKRRNFLTTCLNDANFNEESTQANVLLLFEVARRRSDDTFYARLPNKIIQPIYTRNNANNAIEAVMGISNDEEAYKNWASELITMFGGEAGRFVSGDPYYNRWHAWNEIKKHFKLQDDNDEMSEADDRLSSLSLASLCAPDESGLQKDEKGDYQ